MTSIFDHMSSDHKRCDGFFLDAEKAASKDDWPATQQAYQQFYPSLELHFTMEEKVLFPAFEQAQGSEMGPTQVMRHEHEQMRGLMRSMQKALDAEDKDTFLGEAETLLMFIQQHNAKEEMMLYPMADQLLADKSDQIISEMQTLAEE